MTGVQPNAMQGLAGTTGDAKADAAAAAGDDAGQQEAEQQPKYAGDMPDDPEEARTYRPGEETPGGTG